jgi:galactokinase
MPSQGLSIKSDSFSKDRSHEDVLQRLGHRVKLESDDLCDKARSLLLDRFEHKSDRIITAYALGCVGILNEHTHYFEGFSLIKPLPFATAVAMRPVGREGIYAVWDTVEKSKEPLVIDEAGSGHMWNRIIGGVIRTVLGTQQGEGGIELAIVSTVPYSLEEGYWAALGIAVIKGLHGAFALKKDEATVLRQVKSVIAEQLGRPFGIALLLSTYHAQLDVLLLVDNANQEHVALSLPPAERLTWGLVQMHVNYTTPSRFFEERQASSARILTLLQHAGFEQLESFRDLEHRDLEAALNVLPVVLRPVLRHLVTENRRVVRMVMAFQRSDWQLMGALMVMSQASLQRNWGPVPAEVDFVMAAGRGVEGVYGARRVGHTFGNNVLIVGQPLALIPFLDQLYSTYIDRF